MAWVFNYDGDDLQGWLYQQGDWRWGSVLTWHVIDLEPDNYDHDYAWSCHLWLWSFDLGWRIYKLNTEHIAVRPCDVAWNPWMEHTCGHRMQWWH